MIKKNNFKVLQIITFIILKTMLSPFMTSLFEGDWLDSWIAAQKSISNDILKPTCSYS